MGRNSFSIEKAECQTAPVEHVWSSLLLTWEVTPVPCSQFCISTDQGRQGPVIWNELDTGVELVIFLFCLQKCCKGHQLYFEILLEVFVRGVMILKMFHFFLACMRKGLHSNSMAVTASCMLLQLPVPNQSHTETHAHTFTRAHQHRDMYEHTHRATPPAYLKI